MCSEKLTNSFNTKKNLVCLFIGQFFKIVYGLLSTWLIFQIYISLEIVLNFHRILLLVGNVCVFKASLKLNDDIE